VATQRRPLEVIQANLDWRFVDDEGELFEVSLLPALEQAQIDAFAEKLPCPLPQDLAEVLRQTSGFAESPLDVARFDTLAPIGLGDAMPWACELMTDGCGNAWVADLQPDSTFWGPIYYICHDPPVIVYQAPDAAAFLEALFQLGQDEDSPILDVYDRAATAIWREEAGRGMTMAEAAQAEDPTLRQFAHEVGAHHRLHDLRHARPGEGFIWGLPLRRCGTAPLFAVPDPPHS